jgi:hypothetical protein
LVGVGVKVIEVPAHCAPLGLAAIVTEGVTVAFIDILNALLIEIVPSDVIILIE